MISTEPSVQADFYFKKEPSLDSDGNVVYRLYSKSKDYTKHEEYANNFYIHLPENKEIDYIYVDIRNLLKSNALHFDFDAPLNFYYEDSEAKSIRIDISTKLELDKDMKLYPKNVILAPNEKKNIIGFYDDESTPKDCDNKVNQEIAYDTGKVEVGKIENSGIFENTFFEGRVELSATNTRRIKSSIFKNTNTVLNSLEGFDRCEFNGDNNISSIAEKVNNGLFQNARCKNVTGLSFNCIKDFVGADGSYQELSGQTDEKLKITEKLDIL